MRSSIDNILRWQGQPFLIQRHWKQMGEATRLKDGKERSIIFRHDVEVLTGDWLVDTQTEARFFVTDVDHAKDHSGQPVHVRVLYETRLAYERQESISQMVNQLDDIVDAIWALSDEDAPLEKKRAAQVALDEIKNFVRGLPPRRGRRNRQPHVGGLGQAANGQDKASTTDESKRKAMIGASEARSRKGKITTAGLCAASRIVPRS